MKKKIELDFEGFWIERSLDKVPAASGVFAVFEGFYHEADDSVELNKLVYVGESDNVQDAVKDKTKFDEWKDECSPSAELFFSFAPAEGEKRARGAAAITFEQKPPANANKYEFQFEETKIWLTGKTGLLNTAYEVVMADPGEVPPDPEDIDISDNIEEDNA